MDPLFLDVETTGKNKCSRIIQLSWITKDDMFNSYFNPEIKIEIGAMAIHHITPEKVSGKPLFKDYIKSFNDVMDKKIIIAHNAKFDIDRLVFEGVKKPNKWIDSLKVARYLFEESPSEPESYSLQYLRYFLGVDKFLKDEGIEIIPHSAFSDVILLKHIFIRITRMFLEKHYHLKNFNNVFEKMIDISINTQELRIIPFGKNKGKKFEEVDDGWISYMLKQAIKEEDGFSDSFVFTIKKHAENRGLYKRNNNVIKSKKESNQTRLF